MASDRWLVDNSAHLIRSGSGWLGALGFAAPALNLDARDRWIGWDLKTRLEQLDRLVGMSRFLVRPSVHCRNLASRVLSMAMSRLGEDFEERYSYKPWLVETFVDTLHFKGTCYQAANWTRVGTTKGRGRQDQHNEATAGIKDIYVYVLENDFRQLLALPEHAGLGPLPLDAGLDAKRWTEQEFGGAPVGDKRLSARLVQSASVMSQSPMRSFPAAAGGDQALIKGHYRFLEQPDESAVSMENILGPHRQQTMRRMQDEKTVLCIHDGTDLNYNGAATCKGLGTIGKNQTGAKSQGLYLHSTLTATEDGLPLGVLSARCHAPVSRPDEDKRSSTQVPIEEKKNFDWVLALRDCEDVAAQMPHTKLVQVMDREADFFELFDEWRKGSKRTHLLIRAKYNRQTEEGRKLFDAVRACKPALRFQVHVNRQSARPKRSKQKARDARPERVADVVLRYRQVELSAPDYLHGKESIPLWIVHIVEDDAPEGAEPLEWYLLTTIKVEKPEDAERVLGYYCLRWRIEDWHRVLKSGCGIEELRNETAERLKRAVAIYMVIAWRVMLMTLLGRQVPEMPAEVLFSGLELEVIKAYANSRRDLKAPTCLGDAVQLVARLGGYQARKNDLPAGHQVIWVGYSELRSMSKGWLLARQTPEDST